MGQRNQSGPARRGAAVPFSNRKGTSALNALRRGVGVDRLSAWWPVVPGGFDGRQEVWETVREYLPGRRGQGSTTYGAQVEPRKGVAAFVGVNVRHESGQAIAKVEFNPSRVVDPGGWELSGVEELRPALGLVLGAASELVGLPVEADSMRVARLDVARDFRGVEEVPSLIRALGPVPRAWARRNNVHSDPKSHGAETLFVGSGEGGCRLYDKCRETEGEAPEGTVRDEVEARAAWLSRYGGMRTVGEVTLERVYALMRNRWEWSQMGAEVVGGWPVVLRKLSGMEFRQRAGFLSYLVHQAAGVPCGAVSGHTLAKYRRLQRELGIVIDGSMIQGGSGVVRRLDFESGTEVVRVA